ncbi:hypothetical protein LINPERHAP2_LOCUS33714 [Linum perenne]
MFSTNCRDSLLVSVSSKRQSAPLPDPGYGERLVVRIHPGLFPPFLLNSNPA